MDPGARFLRLLARERLLPWPESYVERSETTLQGLRLNVTYSPPGPIDPAIAARLGARVIPGSRLVEYQHVSVGGIASRRRFDYALGHAWLRVVEVWDGGGWVEVERTEHDSNLRLAESNARLALFIADRERLESMGERGRRLDAQFASRQEQMRSAVDVAAPSIVGDWCNRLRHVRRNRSLYTATQVASMVGDARAWVAGRDPGAVPYGVGILRRLIDSVDEAEPSTREIWED